MLIDRLQSLIAVLITLIGVLLANSAPEPTDWMNETHRQSGVNKSLNKNSQDWLDGQGTSLLEDIANHRWLSTNKSLEYLVSEQGSEKECCKSLMEMTEPFGGRNREGMFVELYSDGTDRQRFYEVSCSPEVVDKPCMFMQQKLHKHSRCVQEFSFSYAIVRDNLLSDSAEEQQQQHQHQQQQQQQHQHRHQHRHHHQHRDHDAEARHEQENDGGGGNGTDDGGKQPFQSLFPNKRNVWKLDYIKVRSGCACKVQLPKNKLVKRKKGGGGGGGGGDDRRSPPHQ